MRYTKLRLNLKLMSKIILFIIWVTFSSSVSAKENLPIYKGQLFSDARVALMKAGWKPWKTIKPEFTGVIQEPYIEKGYVEIENCAASRPYCLFRYKKHTKCLRLVASGYEGTVEETTVENWYFDCKL